MPNSTSIRVRRPERPIRTAVQLPLSKSISNRLLIMAAMCGQLDKLDELSDATDTRLLEAALRTGQDEVDIGLGGTSLRFLLAWASQRKGRVMRINAAPELLDRPHDQLERALRSLGARIERLPQGYLVHGAAMRGGSVQLQDALSSQFVSALLLIGPYLTDGITIYWQGTQLSRSYVELTLHYMRAAGADVIDEQERIMVRPGRYDVQGMTVPPDRSAASFWVQIAALSSDATILLNGVSDKDPQGDRSMNEWLHDLVRSTYDTDGLELASTLLDHPAGHRTFDLTNTPDLFQPLVLTMAALGIPATFTGLHNLALKETDRINAVATVLRMLGVQVSTGHDRLGSQGQIGIVPGLVLPTFGDHRMAMAMAPLALTLGEVTIEDPDVVSKSYPGFWRDLEKAGFTLAPIV